MIDIYAIVRVFKRPRSTYATLKSLAMTEIKGINLHYSLIFTPSDDITYDQFMKILKESGLKYYDVKQIPLNSPTENIPCSLEYYYDYTSSRNDNVWFCYIENDNLFNPDWLIRSLKTIEEVEKDGLFVGICTPHHTIGKMTTKQTKDVHGTQDPGADKNYYIKERIPGCVMLFPPSAIKHIKPDDVCFHINSLVDWRICDKLNALGFKVISLKPSAVQHIGKVGIKKRDVSTWICGGRGGVGFVPDEKVKNLWIEFNKDVAK